MKIYLKYWIAWLTFERSSNYYSTSTHYSWNIIKYTRWIKSFHYKYMYKNWKSQRCSLRNSIFRNPISTMWWKLSNLILSKQYFISIFHLINFYSFKKKLSSIWIISSYSEITRIPQLSEKWLITPHFSPELM